uniref:Uncharacterized protein n=1 Tax=Clastoptera arizonana TaxID=38151 RepID=A0A1B6D1I7_9HEMI
MIKLLLMNGKNLKQLQQNIEMRKEEVETQLNNVKSNRNSKFSEQRLKQLQQLKQRISYFTEQVIEQIKLKEKAEKKMGVLNVEILSMKYVKIRLVNQIKVEASAFIYRCWKLEQQREFCKFKLKGRPWCKQLTKIQMILIRQQHLLKKIFEVITAINKRLKYALALQKSTQSRKNLQGNPGNGSIKNLKCC